MTVAVERLLTEHLDTWTAAVETKSAVGRGSSKKLNLVGIKKLRELILELAVRGQLVPQDENDEPAEVLLARIAAERERLVKEKKIKKPKKLPEISEDEKPFDLPDGWVWARVGGFSLIKGGKRLPKGHQLVEEDTGLAYLRVTNMKLGTILEEGVLFVKPETQNLISQYVISSDDLYITIAGTIGDVGVVPEAFDGMNLTENAAKLVLDEGISKFWLQKSLSANLSQAQFSEKTNQLAQPKLALHRISSSLVALPPEKEQHRIVAKVDELMALCDALEQEQESSIAAHALLVENLLAALTNAANQGEFKQAWARVAAHFDTLFTTEQSVEQLKQTILQLAVMGKLVEQDPADEPAGVLLERIAAEKARLVQEKKIKKQKALPEISEDEKVFELPAGWEWARLGSVANLTGGFAFKSTKFVATGHNQVIRMGNIRPDFLRVDEKAVFIDSDTAEIAADYEIVDQDILLTMTGTKGKRDYLYSLMFSGEEMRGRRLFLNQRLCSVRSIVIKSNFLNMVLKDERLVDLVYAKSTGTANQANIGIGALENWVIPVAPLSEQSEILEKVMQLFSICEKLKQNIRNARTQKFRLADTLTNQVDI